MWKTVKNYEKYEVNINGDIHNKKTKKLLKPETFQCIMDAERCTGINNSSIIKCCKGKQKHAGGFVWRYATWAEKKEVKL